jgi:hypothetical protein
MTCSGASDDASNTARDGGQLFAMAHEAAHGLSESPDRDMYSLNCNRVKNLPNL